MDLYWWQEQVLKELVKCEKEPQKHGRIIGYEQGTGKTLIALSLVKKDPLHGPTLVVVPASLAKKWRSEAYRFLGQDIKLINLCDDSMKKTYRNCIIPSHTYSAQDIVLVNYEAVRDAFNSKATYDVEFNELVTNLNYRFSHRRCIQRHPYEDLMSTRFRRVFMDELPSAVKDPNAVTFTALLFLQAEFVYPMTGTPINNHFADLYSPLRLLRLPSVSSQSRASWIKSLQTSWLAQFECTKLLKRYLLKKTREELAEYSRSHPDLHAPDNMRYSIPPPIFQVYKQAFSKEEAVEYCELMQTLNSNMEKLTQEEQQLLARFLSELEKKKLKRELHTEYTNIFLQIMDKARKLCSGRPMMKHSGQAIRTDSTKAQMLFRVLKSLGPEDKVLIFSSWRDSLTMAEKVLDQLGTTSDQRARLDGLTQKNERHLIATRFNSDPAFKFCLMTYKIGATGHDFEAANVVILLDSDYQHGDYSQAIARTQRPGQTRQVRIISLVISHSIEWWIMVYRNVKGYFSEQVYSGNVTADAVTRKCLPGFYSKHTIMKILNDSRLLSPTEPSSSEDCMVLDPDQYYYGPDHPAHQALMESMSHRGSVSESDESSESESSTDDSNDETYQPSKKRKLFQPSTHKSNLGDVVLVQAPEPIALRKPERVLPYSYSGDASPFIRKLFDNPDLVRHIPVDSKNDQWVLMLPRSDTSLVSRPKHALPASPRIAFRLTPSLVVKDTQSKLLSAWSCETLLHVNVLETYKTKSGDIPVFKSGPLPDYFRKVSVLARMEPGFHPPATLDDLCKLLGDRQPDVQMFSQSYLIPDTDVTVKLFHVLDPSYVFQRQSSCK